MYSPWSCYTHRMCWEGDRLTWQLSLITWRLVPSCEATPANCWRRSLWHSHSSFAWSLSAVSLGFEHQFPWLIQTDSLRMIQFWLHELILKTLCFALRVSESCFSGFLSVDYFHSSFISGYYSTLTPYSSLVFEESKIKIFCVWVPQHSIVLLSVWHCY